MSFCAYDQGVSIVFEIFLVFNAEIWPFVGFTRGDNGWWEPRWVSGFVKVWKRTRNNTGWHRFSAHDEKSRTDTSKHVQIIGSSLCLARWACRRIFRLFSVWAIIRSYLHCWDQSCAHRNSRRRKSQRHLFQDFRTMSCNVFWHKVHDQEPRIEGRTTSTGNSYHENSVYLLLWRCGWLFFVLFWSHQRVG